VLFSSFIIKSPSPQRNGALKKRGREKIIEKKRKEKEKLQESLQIK
jgi:hypothetical protein